MLQGSEESIGENVSKWGSKLGKIIEIIRDIIQNNRIPKILVYSQWNDTLVLLSNILTSSIIVALASWIAMEAQAVSRVQRIGQQMPSFVHYVIVENTIESKM